VPAYFIISPKNTLKILKIVAGFAAIKMKLTLRWRNDKLTGEITNHADGRDFLSEQFKVGEKTGIAACLQSLLFQAVRVDG
jgi:hypothetical protein